MRALLREFEANQMALLMLTLCFLLLLLLIGIVVGAIWGVDWNAVLGIAGMGTGSHVSTATNQALQNRSPNYTPLIANTAVPPLPTSPIGPPGAHV